MNWWRVTFVPTAIIELFLVISFMITIPTQSNWTSIVLANVMFGMWFLFHSHKIQ
ncbi:hypothetical protein [Romboutsia sp.]|uniref:hypothetical protein n=1 Tax=Romboutsia sp. TaxID=1965302 RepID=UPI002C0BFDB8|nr:hypothetical protein [Romboutsia sp.]HSQ88711.1 hypothetical protein [Romboutsia sp.]